MTCPLPVVGCDRVHRWNLPEEQHMHQHTPGLTAVLPIAAATTDARRRVEPPAPAATDRSRLDRAGGSASRRPGPALRLLPAPSDTGRADGAPSPAPVPAGATPGLGIADLAACRDVLSRLGGVLGAVGLADRAESLLGAAEVVDELLDRLEPRVRPGRPVIVGTVPGRLPHSQLSPRERDVLALLVEGCSNAAIAEALRIGRRTAESHVANILGKLGVSSRTAAIAHAVRHGLVG
jgi:DNA-binding CsgD family transcriptional regulator